MRSPLRAWRAACLAVMLMAVLGIESSHGQTKTVEGIVRDAHTTIPIFEAAIVALDPATGDTVGSATTDAHGRYELHFESAVSISPDIVPYDYQIRIDGPNPVSAVAGSQLHIIHAGPPDVAGEPTLEMFDVRGRQLSAGQILGAGVYFVRLRFSGGRYSQFEKVVLTGPLMPVVRISRGNVEQAPRLLRPHSLAAADRTLLLVVEKAYYHSVETEWNVDTGAERVDLSLQPTVLAVPADESVYEVTYQPGTIVLDGAGRAALVSADTAAGRFVFDTAALDAAGVSLEAEQVMLLEGIVVRRITSVQSSAEETIVDTDFATLEELIQDGDIGWSHQLRFDEDFLPNFSVAGKNAYLTRSGKKVELKYKAGPYEVKIELVPSDTSSSAEIKAEVTKTLASGLKARLTGLARIDPMTTRANATFRDGKLESVSHENSDQNITIVLDIAAAGPGIDENDIGFIVPQAVFRYVFMVGLFPVQTDFKLQFVFRVKVDPNASATARTTLQYSSDAGLSYTGTDIEVKNVTAQVSSNGGTADAASTFVPVDLQFGVAFPRIEVSLLGVPIVPYFRTGFFIGSTLRFGPVCKTAFWRATLDAGLDIKLFTPKPVTLLEAVLWENRTEEKSDSCPADKSWSALPMAFLPVLTP